MTIISPLVTTVYLLKGVSTLEKDFEEFIVARCSAALIGNKEYLSLMDREHEPEEENDMSNTICYRQGFRDAMTLLLKCSHKM